MKKRNLFIIIVISLLLIKCSMKNPIEAPPSKLFVTIITKEVTHQVTKVIILYQTTTPLPSVTNTIAYYEKCYETWKSQRELNECAWDIAKETKEILHQLVNQIAEEYSGNPTKKEAFLNIEIQWEKLAEEECWISRGSLTESGWYENGSMAPMLVGFCVNEKYLRRIEELKTINIY
jgi:hypothetical protein